MRILLTEDNPVNREVSSEMLELLGYHVDIAENGRQAIDAASKHHYDLILMDCQMPELDGFAATAEIRKLEALAGANRRIPIIALTANAMAGDRERCLAVGMNDYLTKPFTQVQLKDLLHRWINPAITLPTPTKEQDPILVTPVTTSPKPSAQTTHAESSDPTGLVDFTAWTPIKMMARAGHPSLLVKLLRAYLADARPLVDQIRGAIASNDPAMLHAAAHRLKSSSAVLGALTIASLCEQLEMCGRTGQIEEARKLIPRLGRDFEAVCAVFQLELTKEQAA